MKIITMLVLAATAALAGPPLICERIQIGNAKSLPWKNTNAWNGVEPSYNPASLVDDTLAILTPSAPLPLRMETLRRAAIYSAKSETAASELTARLLGRLADWEAAGRPAANGWFDAGYFVETLSQLAFAMRYDMVDPAEKPQWKIRGDGTALIGKPWIEKAVQLGGGKGMEAVLAKVGEYRQKPANKLVSTK